MMDFKMLEFTAVPESENREPGPSIAAIPFASIGRFARNRPGRLVEMFTLRISERSGSRSCRCEAGVR